MLTKKQAELLLEILHNQFPATWKIMLKAIFYRVANGIALEPIPEIEDMLPKFLSITDLAQIALVCKIDHFEDFVEIIRLTLSPQQELQMLTAMMQLTVNTDPTRKLVYLKDLFRGESLAFYLLDDVLKKAKKELAASIESECDLFISKIYNEIMTPGKTEIPEILSLQCTLTKSTQISLSIKLSRIHQAIIEFLQKSTTVKYCMALIKYYAQQHPSDHGDELIDFLMGTLGNRIISSTLSRYVIPFSKKKKLELDGYEKANKQKQSEISSESQKVSSADQSAANTVSFSVAHNFNMRNLQKMRFEWLLANRFLSAPFSYLICSVRNKETFPKTRLPETFEDFLLSPLSHAPYREFCLSLVPADLNQLPKIADTIQVKKPVKPEIKVDVFKEELILRLWLAVKEIFLESEIIKDEMLKDRDMQKKNINFAPLYWNYLPTVIKVLLQRSAALVNITNIDSSSGKAITALIGKLEKIKKCYLNNFQHQEHIEESCKSPRNSAPAALSPRSPTLGEMPKAPESAIKNEDDKKKRVSLKGFSLFSSEPNADETLKNSDSQPLKIEVKPKRLSQKEILSPRRDRDVVVQSTAKDEKTEHDKAEQNITSPRRPPSQGRSN